MVAGTHLTTTYDTLVCDYRCCDHICKASSLLKAEAEAVDTDPRSTCDSPLMSTLAPLVIVFGLTRAGNRIDSLSVSVSRLS